MLTILNKWADWSILLNSKQNYSQVCLMEIWWEIDVDLNNIDNPVIVIIAG